MLDLHEFQATNSVSGKDNKQYIRLLYQVLVGREPDGAGLHGYLAQLDEKKLTRTDLARALIQSAEFQAKNPQLSTVRRTGSGAGLLNWALSR